MFAVPDPGSVPGLSSVPCPADSPGHSKKGNHCCYWFFGSTSTMLDSLQRKGAQLLASVCLFILPEKYWSLQSFNGSDRSWRGILSPPYSGGGLGRVLGSSNEEQEVEWGGMERPPKFNPFLSCSQWNGGKVNAIYPSTACDKKSWDGSCPGLQMHMVDALPETKQNKTNPENKPAFSEGPIFQMHI